MHLNYRHFRRRQRIFYLCPFQQTDNLISAFFKGRKGLYLTDKENKALLWKIMETGNSFFENQDKCEEQY